MQHRIPVEEYGPEGEVMSTQIKACVHCGFCLASCPTYQTLGEEMDSPRGRIYLMKETLEHRLDFDDAAPFIDRCLGCLACVPACPSGVQYGELLISFREHLEQNRHRSLHQRLIRFMVRYILPFPSRFRFALALGRLGRRVQFLLPDSQRRMLDLLPARNGSRPARSKHISFSGAPRARVALLTGCVQLTLAPEINEATLRVLAENRIEVVPVPGQGCCGALAMHCGEKESARKLASNNLHHFPSDIDAILTNAAGCGSGMKEYPLLFIGTELETQARSFASRVQDITVFLDRLGLRKPPALSAPVRVAYHDACHLANAQNIRSEPRSILGCVENVELIEIAHAACCGSAGTYNLEQPEIAGKLGEEKARALASSSCQAIVSGNIGCLVQIEISLKKIGIKIPVMHTIEVLDRAYRRQPLI